MQETLRRGANLAGTERVVTVVAAKHADWWRQDTVELPADNVVVQPLNRGTAAGVLLPLLVVARRDPDARVVVLPSDHFVERESVLDAAARRAFEAVERDPEAVVLLGITPDRPDPELGWIIPGRGRRDGVVGVERFVEKPPLETAARLLRRGGVWNSFIFVGRVATLLELYRRSLPALLEKLAGAVTWDAMEGERAGALESAYPALETRDFSRDLLESNPDALRVLAVATCGWSDLGTPDRLARCARALASLPRVAGRPAQHRAALAMPRPVLAAVV